MNKAIVNIVCIICVTIGAILTTNAIAEMRAEAIRKQQLNDQLKQMKERARNNYGLF